MDDHYTMMMGNLEWKGFIREAENGDALAVNLLATLVTLVMKQALEHDRPEVILSAAKAVDMHVQKYLREQTEVN